MESKRCRNRTKRKYLIFPDCGLSARIYSSALIRMCDCYAVCQLRCDHDDACTTLPEATTAQQHVINSRRRQWDAEVTAPLTQTISLVRCHCQIAQSVSPTCLCLYRSLRTCCRVRPYQGRKDGKAAATTREAGSDPYAFVHQLRPGQLGDPPTVRVESSLTCMHIELQILLRRCRHARSRARCHGSTSRLMAHSFLGRPAQQ